MRGPMSCVESGGEVQSVGENASVCSGAAFILWSVNVHARDRVTSQDTVREHSRVVAYRGKGIIQSFRELIYSGVWGIPVYHRDATD